MTNRRPFVGGNWKMNTDLASAVELADDIVAEIGNLQEQCDIAVLRRQPGQVIDNRRRGILPHPA